MAIASPQTNVVPLGAQTISEEVLLAKYAKSDERSIDDVRRRVARALADAEAPEARELGGAFPAHVARRLCPGGSQHSAAGTPPSATLINCFVQPVGDSIAKDDKGYPGISTSLTEAAETMRLGGGVGYDFSRTRPRGARLGSTKSNASGPRSPGSRRSGHRPDRRRRRSNAFCVHPATHDDGIDSAVRHRGELPVV
ncbi:MAG: hypothetical protein ABJA94_12120 [Rhodoglobus sp.]